MAEDNKPKKGGFTVGELGGKMRKYGLEISLCVILALSGIFAVIYGGSMLVWAALLSMICAIVGVLVPKSMHKAISQSLKFIYREKVTSIIILVVGILISIILPIIIFAIVGLFAGKSFALDATSNSGGTTNNS